MTLTEPGMPGRRPAGEPEPGQHPQFKDLFSGSNVIASVNGTPTTAGASVHR